MGRFHHEILVVQSNERGPPRARGATVHVSALYQPFTSLSPSTLSYPFQNAQNGLCSRWGWAGSRERRAKPAARGAWAGIDEPNAIMENEVMGAFTGTLLQAYR